MIQKKSMCPKYFIFQVSFSVFSLLLIVCALKVIWPRTDAFYDISPVINAAQHTKKYPEFVEWWYFDGQINGGRSFNLTFWTASNNLWVELDMFDQNTGKSQTYKVDVADKDSVISTVSFQLKMAESWAYEDNGVYRVSFKNDRCHFEFDLKPMIRPFAEKAYFPLERYEFWPWVAAVPRGKIQGFLIIDGKKVDIAGEGYHDHNYFPRLKYYPVKMKGWYWGRFFTPNYTMIVANLKSYPWMYIYLFKQDKHVKSGNSRGIFEIKSLDRNNLKRTSPTFKFLFDSDTLFISNENILLKNDFFMRMDNKVELKIVDGDQETIEKGQGLSEIVW